MVMGYGAGPPEADHAAVASGKHTRRLKIAPFAATAQSNPPRRRRITHQPHECECKDLSASLPIASFPCANLMIRGHLRRHQGPRSSSWTLAITSTETSKVWFFLPSSGRHDRRAKHLCRALFLHGLISLDENLARLRKKKKILPTKELPTQVLPLFRPDAGHNRPQRAALPRPYSSIGARNSCVWGHGRDEPSTANIRDFSRSRTVGRR